MKYILTLHELTNSEPVANGLTSGTQTVMPLSCHCLSAVTSLVSVTH